MRLLIPLAILLIIASCSPRLSPAGSETAINKNHEIERVRFYSRGCTGTCPHFIIEVDSFLNYKYYGEVHAELQGYFISRISQNLWDSITTKLEGTDYKNLNAVYTHTDNAYTPRENDIDTDIIIWYNSVKKQVAAQTSSLPASVAEVWQWLMYTYRKVRLVPAEGGADFFKGK